MAKQFLLLKQRRFLPLFLTQFLGAFNDNLYKSAVAVSVAYGLWDIGDWRPEVVVSMAAAVFIFPFIMVTPVAGGMADKFDKARLIRHVKLAEIFIVLTAVAGLVLSNVVLLLVALFALGVQSAVFSPCKFSILPQHLHETELIGGNAMLNTGTYLAILAGTIIGGLLGITFMGLMGVSVILVLCAGVGYASSFFVPKTEPHAPDLVLNFNVPAEIFRIFRYVWRQPSGIFHALVGGAWFFFVGATLISQFPNITTFILNADNIVLTFFMVIFSVGIAVGGLLNERLLQSKVEATFVPLAALMICLFNVDLYFASAAYYQGAQARDMIGLLAFLSDVGAWRIVFDIFGLSIAGGVFIVPLKAIIQHRVPEEYCSRVVASSGFLDAVFVLASALIASLMLSAGFMIYDLFVIVALGSFVIAGYMCKLLPHGVLKRMRP